MPPLSYAASLHGNTLQYYLRRIDRNQRRCGAAEAHQVTMVPRTIPQPIASNELEGGDVMPVGNRIVLVAVSDLRGEKAGPGDFKRYDEDGSSSRRNPWFPLRRAPTSSALSAKRTFPIAGRRTILTWRLKAAC